MVPSIHALLEQVPKAWMAGTSPAMTAERVSGEDIPMSAEARLKQLGLVLPQVPTPVANYLPYRIAGNLLFLAGQGPRDDKGNTLSGKVGADVTVEEGYRRARIIGLQLLSTMKI